MTAAQKIFILTCKKLGIEQEQVAICMSILSPKEIEEIDIWIGELMEAKGKPEITEAELMEEIYDRILAKNKAGNLDFSVQRTAKSTDSH